MEEQKIDLFGPPPEGFYPPPPFAPAGEQISTLGVPEEYISYFPSPYPEQINPELFPQEFIPQELIPQEFIPQKLIPQKPINEPPKEPEPTPAPESKDKKKSQRSHKKPDTSGLITTAEHEPHVVLAKRYPLLLIVILIMVAAAVGTAAWGYHQTKFGYPPTDFSQAAYSATLFALICLFVVSLFSVIVLRDKIHHLGLGYLIMFTYVLTFYFCLKGGSRAFISIRYDDILTIEEYIFSKNGNRTEGQLPQFFHRLQINFQCCGTRTVDRMNDWPNRLQTHDLPKSCCKSISPDCGKLLARTSSYKGTPKQPMRTPSGYFLALSEGEMESIIDSGKPVKITRPPDEGKGRDTFVKVIKEFYFQSLRAGYPAGYNSQDMKRVSNDIINPHNIPENGASQNVTTIGCRNDMSLEKITTLGWEIQNMLDYETTLIHIKTTPVRYNLVAWKIPTCRELGAEPPFHLASNYNREIINARRDVKFMWYVSRGITENLILKDTIWETYCESPNHNLLASQENKIIQLIRGTSPRNSTRPTVGKFFITFVHRLMLACLAVSAITAVLLFIVFLIFWKYYSRMKLEEFANLPYPPEFDALKARQQDMYEKHNKAEYHKEKFKTLLPKEEDPVPVVEEPPAPLHTVDYENVKNEFDLMFGPTAPAAPRPEELKT